MKSILPIVVFAICIAVGLWTVLMSIRERPGVNWEPALGVFFILIGFNGFTAVRLLRLEKAVKELREKRGGD